MSQTTRKVAGMSIAKKKVIWKYMRHSLVRSPNQSVSPTWSRRVHCVMEPVTAAAGAVGATVGPIVIANNTGARVSSVYTTGNVAVCGGVENIFGWLMTVVDNCWIM